MHLGAGIRQEKVRQTYQWIREVGFSSVNIDLLFGAPGQSIRDWRMILSRQLSFSPITSVPTASPLRRIPPCTFASRRKVRIDPEREAEFYEFAWDYLPRHGYDQYEVSNYAKSGHTCRHNLNTWGMNEWIGYGPSACSIFGCTPEKCS